MSRVPHNPHGMKPVNLADIWEDLFRGIKHIYSRENMLKKRYMELYTYPSASHVSHIGLGSNEVYLFIISWFLDLLVMNYLPCH